MKKFRNEYVQLRGHRAHVRVWGEAGAPKLFMLHGLADFSASFQFLVDAFKRDWHVLALDWRGFGLSAWNEGTYWYPDYFADLDAFFDHYSPDEAVQVVGHSLGGNVFGMYAGMRPQRVKRFALLEAFGLLPMDPEQAPDHFAKWLDQQKNPPGAYRDYASPAEMAERLMRDNPRLLPERAAFLAREMLRERGDGRFEMSFDPAHRRVNPIMYRIEEAKACWRRVTAPSLWIMASDSFVKERFATRPEEYAARKACFPDVSEALIEDSGHNMQHDQPERLAQLLEDFLE